MIIKDTLYRFVKWLRYIFYYKRIFAYVHKNASINSPLHIDGPYNMYIGNIHVGYKTWLAAMPLTDAAKCKLTISDGCILGHFNHIYATGELIIEKNVLTADRVYISDNLHGYENVELPILEQPIKQNGHVVIGEGSWLGENVCVVGASVGKHCVIGANSVVTKDIPDYCVAVGIPAKVIKRYDFESGKWVRC